MKFKLNLIIASLLMSVLTASCSDSDDKEMLDGNLYTHLYVSVTDEAGVDLLDPNSETFVLDRTRFNQEHMSYTVDVNPDKESDLTEPTTLKQRDGRYALYLFINTAAMQNSVLSIPLADDRNPILLQLNITTQKTKQKPRIKSFLINDAPCALYDDNVCTFNYVLK